MYLVSIYVCNNNNNLQNDDSVCFQLIKDQDKTTQLVKVISIFKFNLLLYSLIQSLQLVMSFCGCNVYAKLFMFLEFLFLFRKNFCHTVCGGKCVNISFSRTMKMLMLEQYGMSRQLLVISGFAEILKKKSSKFSFLGFDCYRGNQGC